MRLAGELLEHPLRLVGVRRLAEDLAAERDRGVDAEHRPVARLRRDRARLPARVLAHELDGVGFGRVVLDVVGRDDVEGDPELLEDRAPLRARRREQQRLRRRASSPLPRPPDLLGRPLPGPVGGDEVVVRVLAPRPAPGARRGRAPRSPFSRRSRIQSPWPRWNSTPSSSQSRRCRPNCGLCERLVRTSSSGGAEDRERRVAQEDELAARPEQPRRLRDPAVRVGTRSTRRTRRRARSKERVGQRPVSPRSPRGAGTRARLALHLPRGLELRRRDVDADRSRAATREPGGEVRRAAAELDHVLAVDVGQHVQLRLRDPPRSPR